MSSIGKLSEFQLSSGSWLTYIDRLEQYFKANGTKEELYVAVLIACVGDATYDLMVDLCSPRKPAEVPYKELKEIVRQHIEPTPSILAERYKFRKRVQATTESIAQFAAALKHLARNCDFKQNLNENLRDQFVCGLYDEHTRQKLFSEGNPTYVSAYKIATIMETAAIDAASVEQPKKEVTAGAVHALSTTRNAGRPRAARNPTGGGPAAVAYGYPPGTYTGRQQQTHSMFERSSCSCCGSKQHVKNNCKFKGYACRICLKEGHLKRMCPNKRREKQVFRLDVEAEEEPYYGSPTEEEYSGGEGPSGLYMVQLRGSDPVIAEVEVEGRPLRMHVDTGSPISCISDLMYDKLFANFTLNEGEKCSLKGYDGNYITCLGYIEVNVKYDVFNKRLKLYVIYRGGVPLLGREWLKQLNMDVVVVNSLKKCVYSELQCGLRFNKDLFIKAFPTVFSGKLGKLVSERATLRVRDGARPVYRRARPLPLALRPRVDDELQRMEKEGIISPITSSDWASCLVVVLKSNGYDIEYVKSTSNNADALSRLPIEDSGSRKNDDIFIKFIEDNFPIDSVAIRAESTKDKTISKVLEYTKHGWPTSMCLGAKDDIELNALWRRRDELCVEGGCLLWGHRVVVPGALRASVLSEVHGAHLGIVKCKGLARSYVWWPRIDEDIERMCAACKTCSLTADMPPKSIIVPWSWPREPFERINIDFFSHSNNTYLILVDGHSKWIEVIHMTTTTASNTINKLKEIFSRFGLPKKLVSDNGPPFTSNEFTDFLKKNGIKHVTSAPYHPSSNGEAENAVRTVKRALKKADVLRVPLHTFLQRFLMDYRNTVHSTTGETPSKLLLGRNLRTRLDLLKNNLVESVSDRLKKRAESKSGVERQWETESNIALKGDDVNGLWRDKRRGSLYKGMGVLCCVSRPNYL
ncbi:unnamed protein product [Arctia plantaginis]|uniref:RNA-directed DNA polymerase n=2 Tax=Noctuoidea TaxID=37570 RepID=A0A8S1A5T9_ARCPL|nr:unnamed protein product [Arctia plantaginis]